MTFNASASGVVAFLAMACVMPSLARADDVVIDEDVWVVLLDEPASHLKKARESYLKKDFKAAGAEIEKAAAYCRIEASRATGDTKNGLMAAGHELEKLAGDVRSGAVDSIKSVDAAFARAHHALAKHHYLKASESWSKKEVKKTGHALHAAAAYVKHGFDAAGLAIDTGARETLDGARDIAGSMVSGSGKFGEEVGSSIEDCGQQTELLGKHISRKGR